MPRWRNGRRGGLKNRCSQGLESSTLSRGTFLMKHHRHIILLDFNNRIVIIVLRFKNTIFLFFDHTVMISHVCIGISSLMIFQEFPVTGHIGCAPLMIGEKYALF